VTHAGLGRVGIWATYERGAALLSADRASDFLQLATAAVHVASATVGAALWRPAARAARAALVGLGVALAGLALGDAVYGAAERLWWPDYEGGCAFNSMGPGVAEMLCLMMLPLPRALLLRGGDVAAWSAGVLVALGLTGGLLGARWRARGRATHEDA
jgi:hypothetical protein